MSLITSRFPQGKVNYKRSLRNIQFLSKGKSFWRDWTVWLVKRKAWTKKRDPPTGGEIR